MTLPLISRQIGQHFCYLNSHVMREMNDCDGAAKQARVQMSWQNPTSILLPFLNSSFSTWLKVCQPYQLLHLVKNYLKRSVQLRVQPLLNFPFFFNFRGIPVGILNHSIQQYLTEVVRVCGQFGYAVRTRVICHVEGLTRGQHMCCLTFINDLFWLSSNIILMEHNWARLEWPIPCEKQFPPHISLGYTINWGQVRIAMISSQTTPRLSITFRSDAH